MTHTPPPAHSPKKGTMLVPLFYGKGVIFASAPTGLLSIENMKKGVYCNCNKNSCIPVKKVFFFKKIACRRKKGVFCP